MKRFTPRIRWVAGVLAVVVLLGAVGWYKLLREEPRPYLSDVDYFKYGSVGVEAATGLPYAVWTVLPEVFGDLVGGPGGYAAFGFVQEPGRTMPIGLPVQTVGFPRVGLNCGLCHIGSVREHAGAPRQILIGAPNSTLDLQRYFRFLFAAASDERFTPEVLIPAIELRQTVSPIDRLLLRFLIIPQLQSGLLEQKRQLWWMDTVPDWGPGRVDPFNPAKVQLVHLPWDGTIGAARMVPLWNWNRRTNFGLHRDGLNTSLTEIFLNSGIGNGASNDSINRVGLARLQKWVGVLEPPAYPFAIDSALAARARQYSASIAPTATPSAAARPGNRSPSSRSGPTAVVSTRGRSRHVTASTGSATTIGATRISARPAATWPRRWTVCGRARRIFTTARCRPWPTCCALRLIGQRRSTWGTTSMTSSASASSVTAPTARRQAACSIRICPAMPMPDISTVPRCRRPTSMRCWNT